MSPVYCKDCDCSGNPHVDGSTPYYTSDESEAYGLWVKAKQTGVKYWAIHVNGKHLMGFDPF